MKNRTLKAIIQIIVILMAHSCTNNPIKMEKSHSSSKKPELAEMIKFEILDDETDIFALVKKIDNNGGKIIGVGPNGKLRYVTDAKQLTLKKTRSKTAKRTKNKIYSTGALDEDLKKIKAKGFRLVKKENPNKIAKIRKKVQKIIKNLKDKKKVPPPKDKPINNEKENEKEDDPFNNNDITDNNIDLPNKVDNSRSQFFPPVGDQGGEGSCVGWAVGYYNSTYTQAKDENIDVSDGNTTNICSPSFVYNLSNNSTTGSSINIALEMVKNFGCSNLDLFPYPDNGAGFNRREWPTEAAWIEGMKRRIREVNYLSLYDTSADNYINQIKTQLANGNLLNGSITAYSNIMRYSQEENLGGISNDVHYAGSGPASQRHALTIVGYDDEKEYTVNDEVRRGAFLIVNSWGTDWGVHNVPPEEDPEFSSLGFMWMAYEQFTSNNGMFDTVYWIEDRPQYRPEAYTSMQVIAAQSDNLRLSPAVCDEVGISPLEALEFNTGNRGTNPEKRIAIDLTDALNHTFKTPFSDRRLCLKASIDRQRIDAAIFNARFYQRFDQAAFEATLSDPVVLRLEMEENNTEANIIQAQETSSSPFSFCLENDCDSHDVSIEELSDIPLQVVDLPSCFSYAESGLISEIQPRTICENTKVEKARTLYKKLEGNYEITNLVSIEYLKNSLLLKKYTFNPQDNVLSVKTTSLSNESYQQYLTEIDQVFTLQLPESIVNKSTNKTKDNQTCEISLDDRNSGDFIQDLEGESLTIFTVNDIPENDVVISHTESPSCRLPFDITQESYSLYFLQHSWQSLNQLVDVIQSRQSGLQTDTIYYRADELYMDIDVTNLEVINNDNNEDEDNNEDDIITIDPILSITSEHLLTTTPQNRAYYVTDVEFQISDLEISSEDPVYIIDSLYYEEQMDSINAQNIESYTQLKCFPEISTSLEGATYNLAITNNLRFKNVYSGTPVKVVVKKDNRLIVSDNSFYYDDGNQWFGISDSSLYSNDNLLFSSQSYRLINNVTYELADYILNGSNNITRQFIGSFTHTPQGPQQIEELDLTFETISGENIGYSIRATRTLTDDESFKRKFRRIELVNGKKCFAVLH